MRRQLSLTGTHLIAIVVVTGLVLAAGLALRSDTASLAEPAGGLTPSDDPEALRVLREAALAEHKVAYTGTQFVSVWGDDDAQTTKLVDLVNSPGHGTVVKLHGGTARQAWFVPRTGDLPDPDRAPAQNGLSRSYTLAVAGKARSAGRQAVVVQAGRPDGSIAARFWIDEETGLQLRRELYGPGGKLVRSSGFTDLTVGGDGFVAHPPPAMDAEAGELVEPAAYTELAAAGWNCCADTLSEFLELTGVRTVDDGGALHLTYSDGLTVTSVFQQRGRLDETALTGFEKRSVGSGASEGTVYVRYGLSSSAVWSSGGLVYTVVSDTPYGLDAALTALPHEPVSRSGPDSVGQRLDRGMTRMVSWLNPFD
ncbi:sigma-E factor regulatory protein RseB domain-containing protein [Flindersiella endophytica]